MEYGQLDTEASFESYPPQVKPPPSWPDHGHIELDSMSFRYASDLPLTLTSLTLSIEPEEKVHSQRVLNWTVRLGGGGGGEGLGEGEGRK